MKKVVIGIWVAILPILSACVMDPAPDGGNCPTEESCMFSGLMAEAMQGDIGRDYGGGVVLRNVQSAGPAVVFDLQIPIAGQPLEPVQRDIVQQTTVFGFAEGFCSNSGAQDAFAFGNTYQVRTFGSDNVLIGASTLTSCER